MSTKKKLLTLRSSDGEEFLVEESVAAKSTMIKNMIEDDCASDTIPVANVAGETLAMVIEYCKEHAAAEESDEASGDLKAYDTEFLDKDHTVLYHLILAANYLNVKELLDALADKVASMIRGKTPEEIRKTFNIKNDFSPEEDAEIKNENASAYE